MLALERSADLNSLSIRNKNRRFKLKAQKKSSLTLVALLAGWEGKKRWTFVSARDLGIRLPVPGFW